LVDSIERSFDMIRGLSFEDSTIGKFTNGASVIHVRFAGESFDLPLATLDVGTMSSDAQIRNAVANNLTIPLQRLDDHVIDRHANGNLTIRPAAVFG
jgi:hypothetical protein